MLLFDAKFSVIISYATFQQVGVGKCSKSWQLFIIGTLIISKHVKKAL